MNPPGDMPPPGMMPPIAPPHGPPPNFARRPTGPPPFVGLFHCLLSFLANMNMNSRSRLLYAVACLSVCLSVCHL